MIAALHAIPRSSRHPRLSESSRRPLATPVRGSYSRARHRVQRNKLRTHLRRNLLSSQSARLLLAARRVSAPSDTLQVRATLHSPYIARESFSRRQACTPSSISLNISGVRGTRVIF